MTQQSCEMISYVGGLLRTGMLFALLVGFWNQQIESGVHVRKVCFFLGIALYEILLEWLTVPAVVRYLPILLFSVAYCYLFHICKWEKPVFLLLLLYNLHTMSFLITNSIYQMFVKWLDGKLDETAPDVIEKIYLHVAISQVIFIIAYEMMLLILYWLFRQLKWRITELSFGEFAFLSVLNITGIILVYMIIQFLVVPMEKEVFILYEEVSDVIWKLPLLAVLLLAGEYSCLYVFCRYKKVLAERESVYVREQQLKQLQNRFEEAQVLYGSLRAIRHDMKNHMQAISGLVEQGEGKEAAAYVAKLNETIDSMDFRYHTGNALCDVVLNDKYRLAKKQDIPFTVHFRYVEGVADFDMGILLSNLCDNAIEASLKLPKAERNVELTLTEKGPCVLLTVENAYDGNVLFPAGEKLPLSTKGRREGDADGEARGEHGIGLRNVEAIAEAYLGSLQVESAEKTFRVTVMLQKRACHD